MNGDDEIKGLLGGKWFWPILCRIDALEEKCLDVMPVMRHLLSDDSADWSFACFHDVARVEGDVNGFCDLRKMGARDVGRMIGVKCSMSDAMAKSRAAWDSLTPEKVAEIESAQPGLVAECKEIARRFAEELTPEAAEIKRTAMEMVIQAGGTEEIEFLSGYVEGASVMNLLRSKLKPARTKREKDYAKRTTVLFFGMVVGETIDGSKSDLSWPELHQMFMESTGFEVDIDEETFKKILSRKGLKGVGKAGRPVNV